MTLLSLLAFRLSGVLRPCARSIARRITPALVLTAGCYHMTVETGVPASTHVVSDKAVPAWFVGLVPPNTVVTARRCPLGVAKVETGVSASNALVSIFTLGIYTPMTVRATCIDGTPPAAYPPMISGSRILRAASLQRIDTAP